jgi:hypothetical protein
MLITKASCPSLPTINLIYNINLLISLNSLYTCMGTWTHPIEEWEVVVWMEGQGGLGVLEAGSTTTTAGSNPPAHQSHYTPAVLSLASWWRARLSRGVWVVSPKSPSTSQHLFCTYYIYLPSWLCLSRCTPWCPTTPIVSTCTCCCGLW